MKAKKLTALLLCILTAFVLMAVSASAADEIGPCEHGENFWEWKHTPQTCTSAGESRRVCTYTDEAGNVCGKIIAIEEIPAHNFKVVYTGKTATCTEQGYEVIYCDWCSTLENRNTPIDPKNHSFDGKEEIIKEATCKETGEKTVQCSREGCNEKKNVIIPVDSTKHTPKADIEPEIIPPTCFVDGAEKYVCAVCDKVYSVPVPTHSDYKTNPDKYHIVETKEATCAQAPSVKYSCNECGTSFTVVTGEKDPDAHDYTDESLWTYTEGATCKEPGKIIKKCKNYTGHRIEVEYAPHVFEGFEIITEQPKCEKIDGETVFTPGKKSVKCIYCTATETQTVTDTHSFNDWVITGSCKEGGTAVRTCHCGDVREETSFKAGTHLNYTYDPDNIVYPTCLNDGYLLIACKEKNCGVTARVFLPELDSKGSHTPGEWVVAEKATCEKSGIRELHCDICDTVTEKVVIPQLSHSCLILKKGIDATCDTDGITDHLYCTECGTDFEQKVIPALGHKFVEQFTPDEGSVRICERCNKYEIISGGETVTCNCLCHNSNGLAKTIWKFITFFFKIFGMNQECKCGTVHY
ncbi:MAG: hypothetical protein IJB74_03125 [Clostridia bacterium]|nr:hypothetical protein [Clostridia bacterium]